MARNNPELLIPDVLRINCTQLVHKASPKVEHDKARMLCEEEVSQALFDRMASDVRYIVRIERVAEPCQERPTCMEYSTAAYLEVMET